MMRIRFTEIPHNKILVEAISDSPNKVIAKPVKRDLKEIEKVINELFKKLSS